MSRKAPRVERMTTTPIENRLSAAEGDGSLFRAYLFEYSAMAEALRQVGEDHGLALESVVASRLDFWDYTYTGEFRFRVWEKPRWRVFVSNKRGLCFDVLASLTPAEARAAWEEFLQALDLADCIGAKDWPKPTGGSHA